MDARIVTGDAHHERVEKLSLDFDPDPDRSGGRRSRQQQDKCGDEPAHPRVVGSSGRSIEAPGRGGPAGREGGAGGSPPNEGAGRGSAGGGKGATYRPALSFQEQAPCQGPRRRWVALARLDRPRPRRIRRLTLSIPSWYLPEVMTGPKIQRP